MNYSTQSSLPLLATEPEIVDALLNACEPLIYLVDARELGEHVGICRRWELVWYDGGGTYESLKGLSVVVLIHHTRCVGHGRGDVGIDRAAIGCESPAEAVPSIAVIVIVSSPPSCFSFSWSSGHRASTNGSVSVVAAVMSFALAFAPSFASFASASSFPS